MCFSKAVEKPPAKDKAKDSEVLNTEKEKKSIARQKERRATLILGEQCVTTVYTATKPKIDNIAILHSFYASCLLMFSSKLESIKI